MSTEPLSARAHRAALRMWDGDPRMRRPELEDYAHLDHISSTTGALPGPSTPTPAVPAQHTEPTSVRAFKAAQRMHADSPTIAQPRLEDFAHLDTARPGPHTGTTAQTPSPVSPAQPPADQASTELDARVRAALSAMRSELRPANHTPAERPSASWVSSAPRTGWMQ